MTSSNHWHVDSIDDALAADFDGSLSGLGMELGTGSFNMSETLMALPTLNSLKQEQETNGETSNNNGNSDNQNQGSEDATRSAQVVLQGKKNRLPLTNYDDCSYSTTKRFCVSTERDTIDSPLPEVSRYRHSSSVPDLHAAAAQSPASITVDTSVLTHMLQLSSVSPSTIHNQVATQDSSSAVVLPVLHSTEFQYILGAATALATKMHEETMTYLNQGQSYEIKLKKLGDLTEMRGKLLKSFIKVGFQERRLQFVEREQIALWQQQRSSERILEIDIPLSYGVYEVINDPQAVNKCEFLWDPTKETGVFIRVNCISTEFTPKKHGGEKGVPFRIQIETYSHSGDIAEKLHAASCQVKVFKPKGADRKHKTDREKMIKRPQSEQEKFQPSYDCTVLTECSAETLYSTSPPPITCTSNMSSTSFTTSTSVSISPKSSSPELTSVFKPIELIQSPPSPISDVISLPEASPRATLRPLSSDAAASEVTQWLNHNRFSGYLQTFTSFCGSDLLRLTRNDLIQICGLTDGIRLYNTLHSRRIPPRLTIYVCPSSEQVFRAIFLENLTVTELVNQLNNVFSLHLQTHASICCCGPSGIKVLLTDQVVQNMQDEAMFALELNKVQSNEAYQVLLKPYSP